MRLLVMRTSAMGDVALTTPVIRSMRFHYPETELVILTRQAFTTFFIPDDGIKFFTPDFKGRHKGFAGIIRLYRDIIRSGRIDHVIDLHDVLRTKMLRFLFRFRRIPVSTIYKDRQGKQEIISGSRRTRLRHTVERYLDVFADAGFQLKLFTGPSIIPDENSKKKAEELIVDAGGLNIGVAPYAKHPLKVWPENNMMRLLELIVKRYPAKFYLFGGREEKEQLNNFAGKIPGAVNLSPGLTLSEELAVIAGLDLMIAMDSSNMHMASLVGIPVISIWGGTDPLTGFGAWQQPENNSIRIPVEELTCRPCTIYGKGKCRRDDFACMNWLTPEIVFEKMEKLGVLILKT